MLQLNAAAPPGAVPATPQQGGQRRRPVGRFRDVHEAQQAAKSVKTRAVRREVGWFTTVWGDCVSSDVYRNHYLKLFYASHKARWDHS